MNRHSWMVGALALLLLAGAVGGWALLSWGGSEGSRPPTTVVTLPEGVPGDARPDGGSTLPAAAAKATLNPAPEGGQTAETASGRSRGQSQPVSPVPATGSRSRPRLVHRGHPIVWIRRGKSLSLREAPGGRVVKRLGWRTDFGSRTVFAVFARRGRWAGVPTPLLPDGRLGWVKLDPSRLRSGWTRYSIDVDLSSRAARLRLGRRVVRSFAVTVGSATSPTPTGRFAITDMFRGNLNAAYGCCALATTATQPNLPSGWLGGDRIAIHGTIGPVGAALSHGCIRAQNADVSALVDRVGLGTPVVIRQ